MRLELLIFKFSTQLIFLFEVIGFYYPSDRQNKKLSMRFSFFCIKGIESLPQTLIFKSLYLNNPILGFVTKTQFSIPLTNKA